MMASTMSKALQIEAFISGFIGYGAFEAPIWFIGPEEAGADCPEDLFARIDAWEKLGREPVVDIKEYGEQMNATELFEDGAAPQGTWRRLIEITLVLAGEEPTGKAIREFQWRKLGRPDGGILLTELMPFAKPGVSSWPYAGLGTELPYLGSLKAYHEAVRPVREEILGELIARHRPDRVFFYGSSGGIGESWQRIAGVPLEKVDGDYRVGSNSVTRFIALKHPNARGKSRDYYLAAANL